MSKQKTIVQKAPVASKNIDKADRKQITAMIMQVIPIILLAAFVPIMVQLRVVNVPDNISQYWVSDGIHIDFFSKAKATYIIIFAALSVLILIGLKLTKLGATPGVISLENRTFIQKLFYTNGTIKMERVILVPLAIYTLFTTLSAMMSEYKEVALNGFPDRYEGLWILLSYIAIWGTIIALVKDVRQVNWILAAIVFSGVIMCIIGIGQYLGNDLFKTDFGKALMIPDNYSKIREDLNFNMPPNVAYSTLFNSNNVGSMMSMLGILGAGIAILSKCIYMKIIGIAFTVITVFTLLASNSRGGYFGAVAGVVFLALMILMAYRFNPKYIVIALVVLAVPVVVVFTGKDMFANLSKLGLDTLIGEETKPISERQTADVATQLLGFTTMGNTLEVITNAGNLYITYQNDDTVELRDEDNNLIAHTVEGTSIKNTSTKFAGVLLSAEDNTLTLNIGYDIKFAFHENEMWYIGPSGYLVKAEEEYPVSPKVLEKYGKMGSSRGIIWGKSIPMLKDNLLIGKGPDNFAMYYPQNDYTSKITYFGTAQIIVDKPHNQYIQIAINQGLSSLIAFIVALCIYFFWSIKNIIKRHDVDRLYITYNVALSSAMVAYLVAGVFNDSIVSVAPIFWIIWGLGCAVNAMISTAPVTAE